MDYNKELHKIISNYEINVQEDIKIRWNKWQKDISNIEMYEVIGGILSRQVTIAINFIKCSSIWNAHIAPIILRSLVDNYINFAWIILNPLERSRQFIYYGLGQTKLELEHRKIAVENLPSDAQEHLINDALEKWINQQKYSFLTEVSLKSWSEVSVRKMAEEANCLDIYNYVYQPFSSCAHNMWNHISRYNLLESDNPLHRFLKKPAIFKLNPDIHYVELALSYVEKMFNTFDRNFDLKIENETALVKFENEMDLLENEIRKIQK